MDSPLHPSNARVVSAQSMLMGQCLLTHVQQMRAVLSTKPQAYQCIPKGNYWCSFAEGFPRLSPTHPALLEFFHPLPHQLVSFIFMVQERLLERPADVGVCRRALEIRGSKLGKFVLREIFLLFFREGQCCIQVFFLQLLLGSLKILVGKNMSGTRHGLGYSTTLSLWA